MQSLVLYSTLFSNYVIFAIRPHCRIIEATKKPLDPDKTSLCKCDKNAIQQRDKSGQLMDLFQFQDRERCVNLFVEESLE